MANQLILLPDFPISQTTRQRGRWLPFIYIYVYADIHTYIRPEYAYAYGFGLSLMVNVSHALGVVYCV